MDPSGILAGVVLFFGSIFGNPTGYDYAYQKQVNSDKLQQEIVTSEITSELKYIKTVDDEVQVYMKQELSIADELRLDTIVANHTIEVVYPDIGVVKRISDLEDENTIRQAEIA